MPSARQSQPSDYRGRPEFEGMYLGLIPMGLVFIFFGLLPLSLDFYWWQSLRAMFWPSAQATVVLADESTLTYQYRWHDRTYKSSRYAFGDDDAVTAQVPKQQFIAAHKPGDQITVRVSPRSPEQAVIDRSLGGDVGTLIFDLVFVVGFGPVGLAILVSGLLVLFRYLRELRRFEAN